MNYAAPNNSCLQLAELIIAPPFLCIVVVGTPPSYDLRPALVAHHGGELLVADLSVAVQVRLADHLVDLLLAQVLAQRRHHLKKMNSIHKYSRERCNPHSKQV